MVAPQRFGNDPKGPFKPEPPSPAMPTLPQAIPSQPTIVHVERRGYWSPVAFFLTLLLGSAIGIITTRLTTSREWKNSPQPITVAPAPPNYPYPVSEICEVLALTTMQEAGKEVNVAILRRSHGDLSALQYQEPSTLSDARFVRVLNYNPEEMRASGFISLRTK